MVENFLRVCAAFGAENGRIAICGDRTKFCWRAADLSSTSTRTRTPPTVTKIWQRHRGPKNVLLAHRWLMFQKVQSGPTCHANPPRSQKVQSWEIGNANTPRSQKVQSWPTGNANRQPPYWWCLVCRTASRGASSLGCLRKSRWSKFVVEMWIFKIDLKFRFEFFCCGMQSCAHHFSHTGRSKIKLDNFAVPVVSLH